MKKRTVFSLLLGLVALAACSNKREANDENFGAAVGQYFETHGDTCLPYRFTWPTDVTENDLKNGHMGFMGVKIPQLKVLETVGLVTPYDTEVDGRDGVISPVPTGQKVKIKRYVLSDAGKKFHRELKSDVAEPNGAKVVQGNLCYGRKVLDKIVRWTPMPGDSQKAFVTYLYKFDQLAEWAKEAQIQNAFPDVKKNIDAASVEPQTLVFAMAADGWETK